MSNSFGFLLTRHHYARRSLRPGPTQTGVGRQPDRALQHVLCWVKEAVDSGGTFGGGGIAPTDIASVGHFLR